MAKDAVLSRIAKGLGAYMEGFDGSTSSEIIVLTIRLKYEWQAAESLDKFPHLCEDSKSTSALYNYCREPE
ncbi:hypothetical protein AnigIFM63309_005749 [Aspergillus niger]|nr:hypothetical protein AnigIFM63309_005749 [Aspergillus niger]